MRLVSVTLKSYRQHHRRTFVFEPSRNLLGGPNEAGKSTIAEAAHRVLFLRAKTGGELQAGMVSLIHQGSPEVTLNFETTDGLWTIEKRFAGSRGTALLSGPDGSVFKDDAAEEKLGALLKLDNIAAGRPTSAKLNAIWGHLWVRQGESGHDPGSHAAPHADSLIRRLHREGAAAALVSETDRAVRDRIAALHDAHFTSGGKPRAHSALDLAGKQHAAAAEALARAEGNLATLETAARDFQSAESAIAAVGHQLPALRSEKSAVEEKLVRVSALRTELAYTADAMKQAAAALVEHRANDRKITTLRAEITTMRAGMEPAEEQEKSLRAATADAAGKWDAARETARATAEDLRRFRLLADHAAALVSRFEKSAACDAADSKSREITALAEARATLVEALDALAAISKTELDTLRKLERDAAATAAALAAIATSIEVISGEILLDGEPLTAGDTRGFSEPAEISVGDARIRVLPGGGASLAGAREAAAAANRKFSAALARPGVATLDDAVAVFEKRAALQQQAAGLETRISALGGKTIASDLAAARSALTQAEAEEGRRRPLVSDPAAIPECSSATDATRHFSLTQAALERLAATETSQRKSEERARKTSESTAETLHAHVSLLDANRRKIRDAETRLATLEETHGGDPARAEAIATAAENHRTNEGKLAEAGKALAALGPELLERDLDRLTRAISAQETNLRAAEDKRVAALARLQLDGSADPDADVALARARLKAATRELAASREHADAIRLLHELFRDARAEIDHDLAAPLAEKISGYLTAIFGVETALHIDLGDDGIGGIQLQRAGGPAFPFASLSGGTREQVAAAIRLALAEILADDHDGTLPVIFDDAFSFSDPERVRSLPRMLDLAASRGLQIIVLTCTPADYSGLGAHELTV